MPNKRKHKHWSEDEIQFLKDHEGEYTYKEYEERMERSHHSIKRKANELDISVSRKQREQTAVNHKFFSNIESKEQAYILGFFVADGYIHIKRSGSGDNTLYQFGLTNNNREILEDIRSIMNSEHKIYEKPKGGCYCLVVGSKSIVEDLQELGYTSNKSFDAHYPDLLGNLDRHFIRGVFDGDGCITRSSHKSPVVYFYGTKELLGEIHNRVAGVVDSIGEVIKLKLKNSLYRLGIYGDNAVRFLEWIYYDVGKKIRMERKYERYLEAVNDEGFYR